MKRPVIGMCAALERARWSVWDLEAMLLPRTYAAAVQDAGGFPVLLVPDPHLVTDPSEALDLIDGLLLAGGADIDPGAYGQPVHHATNGTVPERDSFEIALVRAAIGRDIPVLGICRGMQLINVARGGTLVQHLPEHLGHQEHRRSPGSFDDADHEVALSKGTLAMRVVGEARHDTKSHHHQGVDRLGEGLRVSAISVLDGLPEAIELPGTRFVLGVQWHPEADGESPVIDALVAAAAARGEERRADSSGSRG